MGGVTQETPGEPGRLRTLSGLLPCEVACQSQDGWNDLIIV